MVKFIKLLYLSGYSSRDISTFITIGKTDVARICKPIARSNSIAQKLKSPRQSTHWRTSRANARKIMEDFLGRELQTDEHIHHKDHDHTNNNINNLEILDPVEHAKHHHPKHPIEERHKRPERIKYQEQYQKKFRIINANRIRNRNKFK